MEFQVALKYLMQEAKRGSQGRLAHKIGVTPTYGGSRLQTSRALQGGHDAEALPARHPETPARSRQFDARSVSLCVIGT